MQTYAAVHAGLAEGLPLKEVLASERVDPSIWPLADAAWTDRIEDGGDALQSAFEAFLAQAQARYERRVEPLDDDLRAYLDFVRRWSAEAEPVAFLEQLGLRPPDLLRLQRLWMRRMEAEPSLRLLATQILETDPGEIPVISPGPTPRPSPLREAGGGARHEARLKGTSEMEARATPALMARPVIQEAMEAPALKHLEMPPVFELPLARADAEGDGGLDATITFALSHGAMDAAHKALPFAPAQGVPTFLDEKNERPAIPRWSEGETIAPPLAPPRGPELPFGHGVEPKKSASVPSFDTTATLTEPLVLAAQGADQVMPFIKSPAPAHITRSEGDLTPHTVGDEPLGSGTMAVPLSVLKALTGGLPFARSEDADDAQTIYTEKAPILSEKTSSSGASYEGAAPGRPQEASIAFGLTLAQYASLCAELVVFPEMTEQIFQRYGLTVLRERLTVDLGWQERLRRNPSEYEEWKRLYHHYTMHWSERARRGP